LPEGTGERVFIGSTVLELVLRIRHAGQVPFAKTLYDDPWEDI
jgi:hypothetical protein